MKQIDEMVNNPAEWIHDLGLSWKLPIGRAGDVTYSYWYSLEDYPGEGIVQFGLTATFETGECDLLSERRKVNLDHVMEFFISVYPRVQEIMAAHRHIKIMAASKGTNHQL